MEVFVYRINIIKYINGKLLRREGYIIFGYYNNLFKFKDYIWLMKLILL